MGSELTELEAHLDALARQPTHCNSAALCMTGPRATARRLSVTENSTRPIEKRSNGRLSTSPWKNITHTCEVPTGNLPNHHVRGANLTCRVEIMGLTVGTGPLGSKPAGTFNLLPDPPKGHAYPAKW
jgi:hypothetical protein